jgi:transcriptional regulator with XRE-family HTH domain
MRRFAPPSRDQSIRACTVVRARACGGSVNADRTGFCRSLKDARVRRELTLEAIAESSKISAALLADLERGDLSRWPKGIFRRAFLREYAAAIGLAPEHVVSEARRLFPEEGGSPLSEPARPAEGLRLSLAPERPSWLAPSARRALAACLDVTVVLLAGTVIARLVAGSVQLTTAVVALTYYWAATLCSGATPAALLLDRRRLLVSPGAGSRAVRVGERPRLVFSGPGPSNPAVADAADESESTRELPPRVAKSG